MHLEILEDCDRWNEMTLEQGEICRKKRRESLRSRRHPEKRKTDRKVQRQGENFIPHIEVSCKPSPSWVKTQRWVLGLGRGERLRQQAQNKGWCQDSQEIKEGRSQENGDSQVLFTVRGPPKTPPRPYGSFLMFLQNCWPPTCHLKACIPSGVFVGSSVGCFKS